MWSYSWCSISAQHRVSSPGSVEHPAPSSARQASSISWWCWSRSWPLGGALGIAWDMAASRSCKPVSSRTGLLGDELPGPAQDHVLAQRQRVEEGPLLGRHVRVELLGELLDPLGDL